MSEPLENAMRHVRAIADQIEADAARRAEEAGESLPDYVRRHGWGPAFFPQERPLLDQIQQP